LVRSYAVTDSNDISSSFATAVSRML